MIRKATQNDFRKITASIYKDNKYMGSGCLLWSGDEECLYCVTAKHCTKSKEGEDYNSKIKYHNDGELIELKIKGEKMISTDDDVAIFEIERTDITCNIPMTSTYDTTKSPTDSPYRIVGYVEEDVDNVRVADANYMTSEGKYMQLHMPCLDSDNMERFDEIDGMSGGGGYRIADDAIYFTGIQSRAIDHEVTLKNILFIPLKVISEVLSENNKPLLEEPSPDYIVQRKQSSFYYLTINEALEIQEFSNRFSELNITNTVRQRVHEFFECSEREGFAPYFCGLSGIGKTRSVLEACKRSKYNHIVYYKSYGDFIKDINKWREYAKKGTDIIRAVVDEATLEEWQSINNEFGIYRKIFKPIFIGTVPKDQDFNNNDECYVLKSSGIKDVKAVLKSEYDEIFNDEERDAIYNLSHNDLRLTILIARLYREDKQKDTGMSILHGPSKRLHDKFSSANSILAKTLSLSSAIKPTDICVENYFNMLSLFVDVGCWGDQTAEIKSLASFFDEDDISNFMRAVDYFVDINLGLKKNYAFELSPRALAKLAFEQQGWRMIKPKVDKFMESIPTVIMRKKFFDRVEECSMREEVSEALASWFQRKYGSRSMALLNYENAYEIGTYIEYFPDTGLTWLKDVICNAPNDELKRFGKDYHSGRRQVVFACEHLANFEQYFFTCEEILLRLALNETEMGISNNSQGVWSGFFSMIAANTEVSFCKRFDLLIKRMEEIYSEENQEMFRAAVLGALYDRGVKLVPPKMIGGTITPASWHPQNLDELINTKRYILEKLLKYFDMFDNSLQDVLIQILSEHMSSFASFELFNEYKNVMNAIIKTQQQKNKLIHEIEEQYQLFKRDYSESGERELQRWIAELKDLSLKGRLEEFLSRTVWSYGYSDESKKEFEDASKKLCVEVNQLPERLELIKDVLMGNHYDKDTMRQFAENLAAEDKTHDFMELIKSMDDTVPCAAFLMGYYSGVYKEYNKITDDMISFLDAVKNSDPNFSLWGSIACDISDSGFKRILSLIGIVREMHVLINMRYDSWTQFLDDELKVKLLSTLIGCGNAMRFYICFELCIGWMSKNKATDEIYELYTDLIDTCVTNREHFDLYPIVAALNKLPEKYQMKVIVSLLKMFSFNSIDSNNDYILQAVFKVKNDINEKDILDMLGAKLISSKDEFRGRAFTGLFNRFSLNAVKEWIEENAEERAPLIAYHLSAPNLMNKQMSELTKYMLITFEDDDEVYKNFISGGYNFIAYSVDEYYENREKWYELLNEYEDSKHRLIRKWAADKKAEVKSICEDHERLKAMDSRYD